MRPSKKKKELKQLELPQDCYAAANAGRCKTLQTMLQSWLNNLDYHQIMISDAALSASNSVSITEVLVNYLCQVQFTTMGDPGIRELLQFNRGAPKRPSTAS